MIRGYTVILDVHIIPKNGKAAVRDRKGNIIKPAVPAEKIRRFEAHWTGTFCSFPDRTQVARALGVEGVGYLNSKAERFNNQSGHTRLQINSVIQHMPEWPAAPGDYGNDFITIKIRDFPLYGELPVPTVPAAVQQVAAQMEEKRAEQEAAASVGEAVPAGEALVLDGQEQAVQPVQPAETATA